MALSNRTQNCKPEDIKPFPKNITQVAEYEQRSETAKSEIKRSVK